jgi:murein L,D-transpeptidase YafK
VTDRVPLCELVSDRQGKPSIVVEKKTKRLRVFAGDEEIRSYRCGLGFDRAHDKQREGDCRTPEGVFRVVSRNEHSRWHRSLRISYPNSEDAERGLRLNLITKQQADAIVEAEREGKPPPFETALGGDICIHGGGWRLNWTLGCVALDDADAEDLFDAVPVGTTVTILPESE